MKRDIAQICRKINCGFCCDSGFIVILTADDIKVWEQRRPELLNEIEFDVIDGKKEKIIKRRLAKAPGGKIKKICTFYDFEDKCLIYDVRPEMCRNFSCMKIQNSMFQLLNILTRFINDQINEEKILEPGQQYNFWTDVKVKLKKDEWLMIIPRSSIGIKYNLMISNEVGNIDSDYYGCEDNDGNIMISLYNYGNVPVKVEKGMRVAQGIVMKYVRDTIDLHRRRVGGFGST